MNRNVILTISGADDIETTVNAEYFKKGDSHYLLYEEEMEGFSQSSSNRIKFAKGRLELIRRGTVGTHMIFEENKKHMTRYLMPYGEIMLGIETKKVVLEEHRDFINVIVEYMLEMNGEPHAESRIEICARELPV